MDIPYDFTIAFWGIWAIIVTLIVQALIASISKGSRPGAVPGKINPSLSHDSFVFRAHRTFMNSLENISAMLGSCFLAILVGANSTWTAVFVWLFAVARIIHMLLYYAVATEKNPSLRSWFYLLGLLANIGLLLTIATTLLWVP